MDVPDRLLLNEFPGSYGLLGTRLLYPRRVEVPVGLARDWAPEGLGKNAAKMGFITSVPLRSSRRF